MITRKATPLLHICFRQLGPRYLHSTPSYKAKAQPSPRVRSLSRNQNNPGAAAGAKQTFNADEALPPVQMLSSARKSGVIDIEPEKALEFLRQYVKLSKSPTSNWEQKLCNETEITPFTISILSGILRRCTSTPQRVLAKQLMLSASKLGEKSATFELIISAINTDHLSSYQAPLMRLNHLAKIEKDPESMALLGQVLLSQRKEKEALEWLRKATQPPTGSLDHDGAGSALVNEGQILLNRQKMEEAEEVFRKAALELDEPQAYFHLSSFQKNGSQKQELYLLKAASSGVMGAGYKLGVLELVKIEKGEGKVEKIGDFGMAREWFQVAASDGHGSSMLKMALMSRAVGMREEGLRWVEKAVEVDVPSVKKEAMEMKEHWGEEESSPDTQRIFNVYR